MSEFILKTTNRNIWGKKAIVPYDGMVDIDKKGFAKVSETCFKTIGGTGNWLKVDSETTITQSTVETKKLLDIDNQRQYNIPIDVLGNCEWVEIEVDNGLQSEDNEKNSVEEVVEEVAEVEEEQEINAEMQDLRKNLASRTKAQLQDMAAELEYEEVEWKDLKKSDLIEYLLNKE